jgi:hypothetical protein
MLRPNSIPTDDGDCAVLASSLRRRSCAPQEASIIDAARFDSLSRSLTAARSRRRLTGNLFSLAIGSATAASPLIAEAKRKNSCPPCKKRKKGKCKKKKTDGTPCPGGMCRRGLCATCTVGVQNGRETGVDGGGSCSRCGTGQGCTSPNDCASAFYVPDVHAGPRQLWQRCQRDVRLPPTGHPENLRQE